MTDEKKGPKLLEFPKMANNITWGEALQGFLDDSDETVLKLPIRNMIIVTDSSTQFHFGILNRTEVRSLMGSVQCVMNYLSSIPMGEIEYYDGGDDNDPAS